MTDKVVAVTEENVLEEANIAYQNYTENKDRFKTELRIHHNKILDFFEIVEALFFDNKLVGSKPVSDKFFSKDEVFEYSRDMYHALRRNVLVTFVPEENLPETSQAQ